MILRGSGIRTHTINLLCQVCLKDWALGTLSYWRASKEALSSKWSTSLPTQLYETVKDAMGLKIHAHRERERLRQKYRERKRERERDSSMSETRRLVYTWNEKYEKIVPRSRRQKVAIQGEVFSCFIVLFLSQIRIFSKRHNLKRGRTKAEQNLVPAAT